MQDWSSLVYACVYIYIYIYTKGCVRKPLLRKTFSFSETLAQKHGWRKLGATSGTSSMQVSVEVGHLHSFSVVFVAAPFSLGGRRVGASWAQVLGHLKHPGIYFLDAAEIGKF